MIAASERLVGACPLTRAFSRVVITSAIAPVGLDNDERRHGEGTELTDDRKAQHERAEHPRGPPQQLQELRDAQPTRSIRTAERLDFHDAAMLILRAERHEDRTREGKRNSEQQAGVPESADELIADVLDCPGPPHPSTLMCGPRIRL